MTLKYLPETKTAIIDRYNAGMSLRRISEIYGIPTNDVQDVVDAITHANATDQFLSSALLGPDGELCMPVPHWNTFPQEIQCLALRVAENFNVPVVQLFIKGGRSRPEKLARVCFYQTLMNQHGWKASQIGRACDRSASAVMVAIKLYCGSKEFNAADLPILG